MTDPEQTAAQHVSVLYEEVIAGLRIQADGRYIDATFGRGGHCQGILARLNSEGRILALDKDPEAITFSEELLGDESRFRISHQPFSGIASAVDELEWNGQVNGILFDLGVSSPQLDTAERGFSFMRDGKLDMRMNTAEGMSAADWLAVASEPEIADVLKKLGEERSGKRIARGIVTARLEAPIETTFQLAAIVAEHKKDIRKETGRKIHPATKTFQAIRIYINSELEQLKQALQQSLEVLAPGGVLAVISFHSLEDRIVKRFMRDQARGDSFPVGLPIPDAQLNRRMKLLGKAVRASGPEIEKNPRSRSAVLRFAEKLA